MKVIINYTVYLGECSIDDYLYYVSGKHKDIVDELGYELLKATCGVHRNASRPHIHYHTVNEIKGKKVYKILNAKIKTLKAYKEHTMVHPKFIVPEIKLTFIYEGETKSYKGKKIQYDEEKTLGYPLKEYEHVDDMLNDIDVDDTTNCSIEELDSLRKNANSIYKKRLDEEAKKKDKEEKAKSKKEDLYSHLDNVVVKTNIPHYHGEIELLVRYTVKQMLIYYKMNEQNFSIHQLKNVAINYLYFRDMISERDICVYGQI